MATDKRVKLGETYKDRISGFEGEATGVAEYLYGCRQVLLSKTGGGEPKGEWFDEQRVLATSDAFAGGPMDSPTGRN